MKRRGADRWGKLAFHFLLVALCFHPHSGSEVELLVSKVGDSRFKLALMESSLDWSEFADGKPDSEKRSDLASKFVSKSPQFYS